MFVIWVKFKNSQGLKQGQGETELMDIFQRVSVMWFSTEESTNGGGHVAGNYQKKKSRHQDNTFSYQLPHFARKKQYSLFSQCLNKLIT